MPSPHSADPDIRTVPAAALSAVRPRDLALLVALLAATTILSQFFRTALAVIAPELIRDLALSPRMLGLANGGFFLALLVAQVTVGVAFDRFGPRRVVGALSIFMTVGAALHALADELAELIDRIYECSFVSDLWPHVLRNASKLSDSSGTVLFVTNLDVAAWTSSPNAREIAGRFVGVGWYWRGQPGMARKALAGCRKGSFQGAADCH